MSFKSQSFFLAYTHSPTTIDPITADFIYIRFHGLENGAAHDYTRAELKPWAKHITAHPKETVFVYFNNDVNVRAPQNAREFMQMVGQRAVMAQ